MRGEKRGMELRNMPKNLQKSLQEYISKIKKQTPQFQFSPSSLSSTTSKIFSGCKHPKSLSFSIDRKHEREGDEVAATLEDVDRFLIENFNSLYGQDHDNKNGDSERSTEKAQEYSHRGPSSSSTLGKGGALSDSPRFFTLPPDLYGSHRFFISPTSSGTLFEETNLGRAETFSLEDVGSASASTADPASNHGPDSSSKIPGGVEDCIAVLTVSQNPYEDFRRSMQQVIEARVHHKQSVDWDFMEEILFSYLRLNEKTQYRYVLSAFIDIVATLRQNSSHRGPEGSGSSDSQNNGESSMSKGKRREDL